ncbi:MAG: SDR family oxidoreductase [Polyangiaceae bacterium]|nr:SDR family oxidoreductase [Myxococcales bacterium]MCB9590698.1 SDR family oxidoreductase [Polyangiaceae bacterium]
MKRALVIGGSGQLGQVLCRALHAADARVAFTYFQGENSAKSLQHELGCDAARLDLRELATVGPALLDLTDRLGGIDCLIHAATIGSTLTPPAFDRLEDTTVEGFQELMAVNVGSAYFACQALAPQLGAGQGNIVLLGSVDGIKPVPSPPPYAVSKAALKGLALSLCKALGPSGVCVNVVAPGVLERGASHTLPDQLRVEYLKHCGLKRVGRLEEAANLVCWLGLHNTYITGQTLMVDGGL